MHKPTNALQMNTPFSTWLPSMSKDIPSSEVISCDIAMTIFVSLPFYAFVDFETVFAILATLTISD